MAGAAPYLDYRPATDDERTLLAPVCDAEWLRRDWESEVLAHAIAHIAPAHVAEVKARRLPLVDKVEGEVRARLLKEINHWDRQAEELKARERAGKRTRLPAHVAQERAERLNERLALRLAELQRDLSPRPPSLRGGALIVPAGLGREPRDVHAHKGLGHDIESRDPATGDLYFIEVKGRIAGADAVTLTKNEILCALNVPERFRLAVVIVPITLPTH